MPSEHPGTSEAVKARAVRELRAALTGSGQVRAAVRACWYRNPIFMAVLFHVSMVRWFGNDCDVREITAFVARVREARGPGAAGFPSREAEAAIRVTLGESLLNDQLDPNAVAYIEVLIAVLTRLFDDWQPSTDEVTALFAKSEELAAEKRLIPLVAEHEDRWFATGMPDSPFARLDEPAADHEAQS